MLAPVHTMLVFLCGPLSFYSVIDLLANFLGHHKKLSRVYIDERGLLA